MQLWLIFSWAGNKEEKFPKCLPQKKEKEKRNPQSIHTPSPSFVRNDTRNDTSVIFSQ